MKTSDTGIIVVQTRHRQQITHLTTTDASGHGWLTLSLGLFFNFSRIKWNPNSFWSPARIGIKKQTKVIGAA